MLNAPADMAAVRRNYELLRRALDADSDPLGTRRLLDSVCAKVIMIIVVVATDCHGRAQRLNMDRFILVSMRLLPTHWQLLRYSFVSLATSINLLLVMIRV
jgi:hypothetical protein